MTSPALELPRNTPDLASYLRGARQQPLQPFFILLSLQLFDVAAPLLVGLLCHHWHAAGSPGFWDVNGKIVVAGTVLSTMVFRLVGMYQPDQLLDPRLMLRRLLSGFGRVLLVGLVIAFLSKSMVGLSRIWTVLWICSWVLSALASRWVALRYVQVRSSSGDLVETVAIIGATPWARELCNLLVRQQRPRQRIIGVFDDRRTRTTECFLGSVRSLDELLELGRRMRIDRIYITLPLEAEARILHISRRMMALSIDVVSCPDLRGFGLMRRSIQFHDGIPLIRLCSRPLSEGCFFAKSVIDKLVSAVALLLLSPLLLGIALAVRIDSPGPVLFRQKRHGYNNIEFEVLKFRSMRTELADQDGGRQATRGDARVTALGRFLRASSLDELPQLLNVLRGDMSLVGPRPLPVGMRTRDLLNHEIVAEYTHRHRVRPGITGWAQINGSRGATSDPHQLRQRVELDLYYIDNWSALFDITIVLLTVVHLLRPKNAF